jgi:hypothetical protein
MGRTLEEAEQKSDDKAPKRSYSKSTINNRAIGGPVTRAKAKKMEKEKAPKILYSDAVTNSS